MKKVFFLMFALLLISAASVKSQVTIGSLNEPHEAAVLDLNVDSKGLLLSKVALTEDPSEFVLDGAGEKNTATGMIVYNTAEVLCGPGIYVWDGSKWNPTWNCTPEVKLVSCLAGTFGNDVSKKITITVQDPNTGSPRDLTFLTYNLGANPALDAKEQMAYNNYAPTDITVHGGLYQWGRKDAAHTFRCQPDPDVASDPKFTDVLVSYPNVGDDGKFVYMPMSYPPFDWVIGHDDYSDSWGDGTPLGIPTTPNGFKVKDVEEYYQYPVKGSGDPCPSGWRVPTQHEWALLGHEDSNPSNYTNDGFNVSVSSGSVVNDAMYSGLGTPLSSGLVWVPVKNGQVDTDWASGSPDTYYNFPQMCGYALYTASEWNSGKPTNDLTAGGAPDPLLFLPAAGGRVSDGATYYQGALNYDGALYYSGASGRYWSSTTVHHDYSLYLSFGRTYVNAYAFNDRVCGHSVRCVAEN